MQTSAHKVAQARRETATVCELTDPPPGQNAASADPLGMPGGSIFPLGLHRARSFRRPRYDRRRPGSFAARSAYFVPVSIIRAPTPARKGRARRLDSPIGGLVTQSSTASAANLRTAARTKTTRNEFVYTAKWRVGKPAADVIGTTPARAGVPDHQCGVRHRRRCPGHLRERMDQAGFAYFCPRTTNCADASEQRNSAEAPIPQLPAAPIPS